MPTSSDQNSRDSFLRKRTKIVSNQEAVEAIRLMKDAQTAAKHLTDEAVSRKSKDDISCIVVMFQWHLDWRYKMSLNNCL